MHTTNKRIKYRNGQTGFLLTCSRPETNFPVMSMCEKGNIYHHREDGRYLGLISENAWDIVEVEE